MRLEHGFCRCAPCLLGAVAAVVLLCGRAPREAGLRRIFAHKEALGKQAPGYASLRRRGGNAFTSRRAVQSSASSAVISVAPRPGRSFADFGATGAVSRQRHPAGYCAVEASHEIAGDCRGHSLRDAVKYIDFAIIPHYRSSRSGAAAAAQVAARLTARGLPSRVLREVGTEVPASVRADITAGARRVA